MDRVPVAKTVFSSGEVHPNVQARVDTPQHASGVKTLKNFIVMPQGGAGNRPGTTFVKEVKGAGTTVRLIPFVFSETDAYVLEFGNLYIRFYKDGANLESGGSPYEIVTTYTSSDLENLQFAQSADTLVIVHPDFQPRVLARTSDISWAITDYDYDNGPYMPLNIDAASTITPGGLTGNIVLTAANNIFSNITGSKHATNRTLWQINHAVPAQLVIGSFAATGSTASVACGGTWRVVTHGTWTASIKIEMSIDNGATWSVIRSFASNGSENYNTYGTELYDQFLVRATCSAYTSGTAIIDLSTDAFLWQGVVKITAVPTGGGGSSQMYATADATVLTPLKTTAATADWAEGSWSKYRGYPHTVVYHQDRLVFANTVSEPQTLWMSQTSVYTDFGRSSPLFDSDGITKTLQSREINGINLLVSLKDLIALTLTGEWTVFSESGGITPSSINAKKNGDYGAGGNNVIIIGERAVYMQARKTSIRDTGYSEESGGFSGNDLSLFSSHFLDGFTIGEMAYQRKPYSVIWMVRNDGKMLSLTYEHKLNVNGWALHDTEGIIESICTVPGTGVDELWLVVNRSGTRYVERMLQRSTSGTPEDQLYLDCSTEWEGDEAVLTGISAANPAVFTSAAHGLSNGDYVRLDGIVGAATGGSGYEKLETLNDITYEVYGAATNTFNLKTKKVGEAQVNVDTSEMFAYVSGGIVKDCVNTLSGLDRFDGLTMMFLIDGVSNRVGVSGGVGGFPAGGYGSYVKIGHEYNCDVEILPINIVGNGSVFGLKTQIEIAALWLIDSLGGSIGYDENHLETLEWNDIYETTGSAELVPRYLVKPYRRNLFSGNIVTSIDSLGKENSTVFIRQSEPLPMTILAVIPFVSIASQE